MDEGATETAIDDAVAALDGSLHISVNTAGGGASRRTLGKEGPHPLDAFRYCIELDLVSSFNVARLAAVHMARNEPEDDERGVIISTSSIAAFEGQIGQVASWAAKAGIASMLLTMARDLGNLGIRALASASRPGDGDPRWGTSLGSLTTAVPQGYSSDGRRDTREGRSYI